MKWEGQTFFGTSLILFKGRSFHNALHSMPVTVLALSDDETSIVLDSEGNTVGGPACLIRPMTPHVIVPGRLATIAFLSPGNWSLSGVSIEHEQNGFAQLSLETFCKFQAIGLAEVSALLSQLLGPMLPVIHPRLRYALKLLAQAPGSLTIERAARSSGLSTSRLRAIAKQELGVPVSNWLLWKKLEQATRCVSQGDALAQSAASGGFVDQAHFSNVMRRLLGTSPSEIGSVRLVD